jgi:uncharacterized protein with HEPN domain
MLQSARLAVDYLRGRSRQELSQELQLQDAVVRRLTIVGEAANRVSEPMRDRLSGIPWVMLRGMRNRLVHEYDGVNLDIVWETVRENLPGLIVELERVVPQSE